MCGLRVQGDAGADHDHVGLDLLFVLQSHPLDLTVVQDLLGIRLNFCLDTDFLDLLPQHPSGRRIGLLVHDVPGTVQHRHLGIVGLKAVGRLPWDGPEDELRSLGSALCVEDRPVKDLILYNAALRLWVLPEEVTLEEHLRASASREGATVYELGMEC